MPHVSDKQDWFGIARWQAWAPGVADAAGWRAWIAAGHTPDPVAQPDVSYLPPLLRRRLDRCGRMALSTAWPCTAGLSTVQSVFSSRHGALDRTLELLDALAKDEVLSPTVFSLSVHNSNLGLFSIARSDRGAATALAAGADSLALGLLEGANLIAEGAEQVLVCYADDSLAAPYAAFLPEEPSAHRPFSISLLLTRAADAPLRCRLSAAEDGSCNAPEADLMAFLLDESDATTLGHEQAWRLERVTHAD